MSNIYKKIKISWTYPTQPTSLQIGTVKIYRGTSEFTLDNVLSQIELVSQEYDPTFTSFIDDFELEYNTTYYYMIIVYGDIDSSISAATDLYSIKIEALEEDEGDETCSWLSSSDSSRVIESWTDSESFAAIYMDSLDQFNSLVDQIQSMKLDYFESITPEYGPSRLDKIFSIDFSPWLDAIKAKLKQQFRPQPEIPGLAVQATVENYSLRDMNAPQPIMDALNALGRLLPYQGTTAYEARVDVGAMLMPTAQNQYVVLLLATINFLNHDGEFLMPAPVWGVIQTCFKGGNIAAFDAKAGSKLPDSVLSSDEGTKWLKSQGGFTTIHCEFNDLT